MFRIVHRSSAGWLPAAAGVHYVSEDDAAIDIPTLAALFNRPPSTFRVVPTHVAAHQQIPLRS